MVATGSVLPASNIKVLYSNSEFRIEKSLFVCAVDSQNVAGFAKNDVHFIFTLLSQWLNILQTLNNR